MQPMQPSRNRRQARQPEADSLLVLMDQWPESWAGDDKDEPIGRAIVELLRPFVVHLQTQGFSRKTVRRHLDNLWAIGGEIIREINDDRTLRSRRPERLLLDAIQDGNAPLARHATDVQQAALSATARRLLQFLTTQESPAAP